MTDKLKLFTSPSAFPNPQRLRIFMHEKGIAERFDEVIYNMSPIGEQRGWKHLKMNPWGGNTDAGARGRILPKRDVRHRALSR
jgi:hypothetical protein